MSFLFVDDLSAKEQMEILQGWYYSSCYLAFVDIISSDSADDSDSSGNPSTDGLRYTTLIDQAPPT